MCTKEGDKELADEMDALLSTLPPPVEGELRKKETMRATVLLNFKDTFNDRGLFCGALVDRNVERGGFWLSGGAYA